MRYPNSYVSLNRSYDHVRNHLRHYSESCRVRITLDRLTLCWPPNEQFYLMVLVPDTWSSWQAFKMTLMLTFKAGEGETLVKCHRVPGREL